MTLSDEHIYIDEAISGCLVNRAALQVVEEAVENKEFEAVVIDDSSRLSRSNHQMLTLVLKFDYHQVKIISVSDGIITDEENSKLGIHIRGLINELYLDDLRKKTMRGLEGQKIRGFSTGENVYGYYSKPVGELKLNKRGQPKYEGMVHQNWRTQLQPIRTASEITAHIKILPARQPYLYQKLPPKATQLHLLGMSYQQIAKSLHINRKTATKACRYKGR